MAEPTLARAAANLAAILGAIVQMSDDVKNAGSPLDAQGKLLRMQNSIQKNAARLAPHVKTVLAAVEAEDAMATPPEKFFAAAWAMFLDGADIDGFTLQEMIEKAGLGEWRPATEADIKGTKWEGEIDPGDRMMFLTPAGRAAVKPPTVSK